MALVPSGESRPAASCSSRKETRSCETGAKLSEPSVASTRVQWGTQPRHRKPSSSAVYAPATSRSMCRVVGVAPPAGAAGELARLAGKQGELARVEERARPAVPRPGAPSADGRGCGSRGRGCNSERSTVDSRSSSAIGGGACILPVALSAVAMVHARGGEASARQGVPPTAACASGRTSTMFVSKPRHMSAVSKWRGSPPRRSAPANSLARMEATRGKARGARSSSSHAACCELVRLTSTLSASKRIPRCDRSCSSLARTSCAATVARTGGGDGCG
mmetsp:Transcript_28436/g.91800  ORF Transcript_28436/g.91800 Transcript_28436/m.91800 type:complete len:277 (+) Transcript_28436:518-1348(+)